MQSTREIVAHIESVSEAVKAPRRSDAVHKSCCENCAEIAFLRGIERTLLWAVGAFDGPLAPQYAASEIDPAITHAFLQGSGLIDKQLTVPTHVLRAFAAGVIALRDSGGGSRALGSTLKEDWSRA